MTNTYTWTINPQVAATLTVDDQTLVDVFTSLSWFLTGIDGDGNTAFVSDQNNDCDASAIALAAPNPSGFVAMDDVTPDDLSTWLTAGLGTEMIAALKTQVDGLIAAAIAPTIFVAPSVEVTA